ncbi:hypothetical protein HYX07_05190 [Candidatus Woesearchaeota archaeon]|nr:hypothetical protein [Candidatus Woesearchaeota archaeon]
MKFNMIVNVGIKQSQKEKIYELISKSDKYKSINEFVQEAVSNWITIEYKNKELPKKRSEHKTIFEQINKVNLKLISEELLGYHKLTSEIVHFIDIIKQSLHRFEYEYYSHSDDKIILLLNARQVKEHLDNFIAYLVDRNQAVNLKIPERYIEELKMLRDQFVHNIIAQEVKG